MSDEFFLPKKADPLPDPISALALHAMNLIENSVDQLICDLSTMDDSALETACMQAQALGKAAWRVECAICAEIVSRDLSYGSKEAYVKDMARRLGISAGQLYDKARLCDTFKLGSREESLGAQTLSEIGFFQEAARGDDPAQAIKVIADKKAADPNYTTSDARADVQELKRGVPVEEVETLFWVKIGLKPDEREMLGTLAQKWGVSMAAALVQCLRETRPAASS